MGLQQFLPLTQSPLIFAARSCGDFLALEPWPGGPIVGLGLFTTEMSLPNFYPPHVGEGPTRSAFVPLL